MEKRTPTPLVGRRPFVTVRVRPAILGITARAWLPGMIPDLAPGLQCHEALVQLPEDRLELSVDLEVPGLGRDLDAVRGQQPDVVIQEVVLDAAGGRLEEVGHTITASAVMWRLGSITASAVMDPPPATRASAVIDPATVPKMTASARTW